MGTSTTKTMPVLLVMVLSILSTHHASGKNKKLVTTTRFAVATQCKKYPNTPFRFDNISIFYVGQQTFLRTTINLTRGTEYISRGEVDFTRCKEEATNSCEHFQTLRFNRLQACHVINMPKMPWTPLLAMDPPVKCPIKAGLYKAYRNTVDASKLGSILPKGSYWKVSILATDESDVPFFCLYIEGDRVDLLLDS